MKIFKDIQRSVEIDSVENWLTHCPPSNIEAQWQDFKSSKELAKFWTNKNCAKDFFDFLKSKKLSFVFDLAVPSYECDFDDFKPGRVQDLFLLSSDKKALLTIEAKADESFGSKHFSEEFKYSIDEKENNPASDKLERMINLFNTYFRKDTKVFPIMYQLCYWYAGTLAEAVRQDSSTMIMVNQEFFNDKLNKSKLFRNKKELTNFVFFISQGKISEIKDNEIVGPINNALTEGKNLYVGKYRAIL